MLLFSYSKPLLWPASRPQRFSSTGVLKLICFLIAWGLGIDLPQTLGQEPAQLSTLESALADPSDVRLSVRSGLEGRWKVGFTTWHRVQVESPRSLSGVLEIQTVDGDGNSVRYSDPKWSFQVGPGTAASIDVYAKHGRSDRPIRVVAKIEGKNPNEGKPKNEYSHLLSEQERGMPLSATEPWVIGIGTDRLDLDQGLMKSAGGRAEELRVSELTRLEEIPNSKLGYSGVDAIVFSSSNSLINQGLSVQQRRGLADWLGFGGQMLLTWGKGGPELAKHPEFAQWLPGELIGAAVDCEPGPI
jgi:hypothetical protein